MGVRICAWLRPGLRGLGLDRRSISHELGSMARYPVSEFRHLGAGSGANGTVGDW